MRLFILEGLRSFLFLKRKNMARYVVALALGLLIFVPANFAYPQGSLSLYYKGVHAARFGDKDFAFMYFKNLLREFPESELAESALFAVGEYCFSILNHHDAVKYFSSFINSYPESKAKLFALAYLREIAKLENNPELAEKISKEIVTSKQLRLLFSEFKEYTYWSAFYEQYKAVFFIDKVEIYIDEELFTEISY